MFVDLKQATFFSKPQGNTVEGYSFCHCVKAYMLQKKMEFCRHHPISDLAELSGYADIEKFVKHEEQWLGLQRDIPRGYIDGIGINPDMLLSILNLDKDAFIDCKKMELFPAQYTVRVYAAVYSHKKFPRKMTEKQAVEYVAVQCIKNSVQSCINWPDLKTIWFQPTGKHHTTWYEPHIEFTKNWVKVQKDAKYVGTAHVI
jgi:hypothetical protein